MDKDRFSVLRYFEDNSHEYVERDVTVDEAVESFASYTTGIGAWLGTTTRVIVTDGDNVVSLEWTFETGITRKVAVAV